jgi:uncharacterized protein YbaP (TraB family)
MCSWRRDNQRFGAVTRIMMIAFAIQMILALAPPIAPALHGQAGGEAIPLWEVSRDGHSIYLLGSVHSLRPGSYPLDEALYDAFDSATLVAFEIDPGLLEEAAPAMLAGGMYGPGESLRAALPEDLYAQLAERVDALGMPVQAFDPLKPWLVAITVSAIATQGSGFDPRLGIDMHFHERAIATGKEVVGLETIDDQIGVFEGLGTQQQLAFLRSTLDEMDGISSTMDEIADVWASGDVERLGEMMNESLAGQPELADALLRGRNEKWVPGIEEIFDSGREAIVIVGLGHMTGEGSVTELLAARGYRVERVVPAEAARDD